MPCSDADLFRSSMSMAIRILGSAKLSALGPQAEAFDKAVALTYARRSRGMASFVL